VTLRRAWRRDSAIAIAFATVFGILLAHSLSYSSFFEDPITWGVVAIAAAFVARSAPAPEAIS
jgi:hypothetical protein